MNGTMDYRSLLKQIQAEHRRCFTGEPLSLTSTDSQLICWITKPSKTDYWRFVLTWTWNWNSDHEFSCHEQKIPSSRGLAVRCHSRHLVQHRQFTAA